MAFSNKCIRIAALLFATIIAPVICNAEDNQNIKGETDGKGNVTFTIVLENLPLNQKDIYDSAKDYLSSEYKTAKYKDIKEYEDKGIIYGEGKLNAFYTENQLIGSKVYTADFYLRFDCKDNRARIQMITKDYAVRSFTQTNEPETTKFAIAEQPPFVEGKKGFKKAFEELEKLSNKILKSASSHLKTTTSAPTTDEW